MKKISLLIAVLFLSFLTTQCSKSSDPSSNDPVGDDGGNNDGNNGGNGDGTGGTMLTFGIMVSGEWFASNQDATLYISDQDGAILAEGAVQNNSETTLEVPEDSATRFDATLLQRIAFNGGFLNTMTTYENVSSGSFTLSRNTPQSQDLLIEVDNTGCLLELISSTGGGVGNGTSNNGGNYLWDTSVVQGGDYFMLMRCPSSGTTRYLWQEDINDANIYVDYPSLPTANQAVALSIPSNVSNILAIRGRIDTDPFQINHRIDLDEDPNGTDFSGLVPDGLFDSYYITYSVFNGLSQFNGAQVLDQIPTSIAAPNFDLTLVSTGLDNFAIQSTGTFDAFQARYFYNDPNSSNSISYKVVGASSSTSLAPKSALVDAIFQADAAINASDLEFSQAIASDYINSDTFMEYVKFALEFNGEATATPYKSENVIKLQ